MGPGVWKLMLEALVPLIVPLLCEQAQDFSVFPQLMMMMKSLALSCGNRDASPEYGRLFRSTVEWLQIWLVQPSQSFYDDAAMVFLDEVYLGSSNDSRIRMVKVFSFTSFFAFYVPCLSANFPCILCDQC